MSSESDDEILLRNVNDLKKRLLQTERSLQLLQSPKTKSSSGSHGNRGKSAYSRYYTNPDIDSEPNDSIQPLTLDELTLDPTDDGSTDSVEPERGHSHLGTAMGSRGYQSYSKPSYNVSRSSFESDVRKKLQAVQDENASLRNDKRRIQNQLESTEYQLKAAKKQIHSLSNELETGHRSPLVLREKLANLESEVSAQDETLRDAEDRLEECQVQLSEKESQLKKHREELRNCKADLMHEMQCRQRMENQRDKALRNLEDLNDHITEFRSKTKDKLKKHQDIEDHLRDRVHHSDKEREELLEKNTSLETELQVAKQHVRQLEELSYSNSTLQATTHTLQSSLKKHQHDMRQLEEHIRTKTKENANLQDEIHAKTQENDRLTALMSQHQLQLIQVEQEVEAKTSENDGLKRELDAQKQQVARLKDDLESKTRENIELSELTEIQNERLGECQRDMEGNQNELRRLEQLAEKLQAKLKSYSSSSQSRSPQLHQHTIGKPLHTSSPHDNAAMNGNAIWSEDSDYGTGSDNSNINKAVIAELRMELALKEAEIHKMEAARQRDTANVDEGNSVLKGLRSELTAIVEKNKIGDRKAQELENIISQLEEERNKQVYLLMESQQQMADEKEHSSKLQSQVQHCSLQITDLQHEILGKSRAVEDLETQLEYKTSQIANLEEELEEKSSTHSELISNLTSLKAELVQKEEKLGHVKDKLKDKSQACDDITEKISQVKTIHSNQCQELQQQIDLLQDQNKKVKTDLGQVMEERVKLQRDLEVKTTQITDMEKALHDKQQEVVSKVADHTNHLRSLQQKAEEGSNRVANMEAALMVCKEELTMYIEQLEETKDRHEYEMDKKNKEMAKLERDVQQVRHDGEEKQVEILELEQALHQRQHMLQQSTSRITDLEDKEGHLSEQVSQLEKQLSQVKASSEQDAKAMEKKLHQACLDLEDRTTKLTHTTSKLNECKRELSNASSELIEVKKQLNHIKENAENNNSKITQLELDLTQTRVQLQNKSETANQLADKLAKTSKELAESRDQMTAQDVELTRAQEDLRAAASQMTELQRLLQKSRAESSERHKRIQELSEKLGGVEEKLNNQEQEMSEMDSALRASHNELEHRSAQVSQLDTAVKDRQASMEKHIQELQSRLSQSHYELQQCSKEMGDLDDKCQQQQDLLKEKKLEIQQLEQIQQTQSNELRKKSRDIDDMDEKINKLEQHVKDQKSEELEQGQQLRLTGEQMQNQHVELTETKLKLTQMETDRDQISRELEDAMELLHKKDTEKTRLVEQLGQMRALEADNDARFSNDLLHIKETQERELTKKDKEISQLQNSRAEFMASVNQTEVSSRLAIKRLRESESNLKQEIEKLRDKIQDMEHELLARKEVVEAANEAIVIKEAEVARLNARISGYERATFGANFGTPCHTTSQHLSDTDHSPAAFTNSPYYETTPRTSMRRSISDAHLARANARSPGAVASRDTLLGYSTTDGYGHTSTSRDSFAHRESFDRIFWVPDFPLDSKLLTNTDSGHHFSQSLPQNANNHHQSVYHHDSPAGDLAQTFPHSYRTDMCRDTDRQYRSNSQQYELNTSDFRPSKESKQRTSNHHPSTSFHQRLKQDQFMDELESTDGENLNSLQNMLTYVNRQIADEERQKNPTSQLPHSPSFAPLPQTPQKSSSSPGGVQQNVRTPPQQKRTPPRKKASLATNRSPGSKSVSSLSGRGVSRSTLVRKQELASSSVKPRLMKVSPGKKPARGSDGSSLETTPLKQKLAKQRSKMAASSHQNMKPLDCMADLHNKLKASDERRRQVDQQLFGL